MKKPHFAIIFLGAHVAFILLIIHKQNLFINLSYEKQKKEQLRTTLKEQKQQLLQQHYALSNHKDIKGFAHTQLTMEPITMAQVKKLKP